MHTVCYVDIATNFYRQQAHISVSSESVYKGTNKFPGNHIRRCRLLRSIGISQMFWIRFAS